MHVCSIWLTADRRGWFRSQLRGGRQRIEGVDNRVLNGFEQWAHSVLRVEAGFLSRT